MNFEKIAGSLWGHTKTELDAGSWTGDMLFRGRFKPCKRSLPYSYLYQKNCARSKKAKTQFHLLTSVPAHLSHFVSFTHHSTTRKSTHFDWERRMLSWTRLLQCFQTFDWCCSKKIHRFSSFSAKMISSSNGFCHPIYLLLLKIAFWLTIRYKVKTFHIERAQTDDNF